MACYHPLSFTFQYVSINTSGDANDVLALLTLHSNMFLLIRLPDTTSRFLVKTFTFQYVSINTL